MAGMLQIITYVLAFYLVMKGVEILQIALASPRQDRGGIVALGLVALVACVVAAVVFINWQDQQASSLSASMPRF